MSLRPWISLLIRNKFRVSPSRVGFGVVITFASIFNSIMRLVQEGIFYNAIQRTKPNDSPIFIIGHWRSGTTLLHELMILDARYTYANTFQCMAPNHFLVTSRFTRFLKPFLPANRPMDKMALGWDTPQEDEFALANLGLPSPYLTIAFPNEPIKHQDDLTLNNLSPEAKLKWQAGLKGFMRRLNIQDNRPLILKSPTHTGRVKSLIEMYPKAKFILITRNPYEVFYSTRKLWKALYLLQGLQVPNLKTLDEKILGDFETMFTALKNDHNLVPKNQFIQTDYQALLNNPRSEMAQIYEHLNLGEFNRMDPKIADYFSERKNFPTDSYDVNPDIRQKIDHRWGRFLQDRNSGKLRLSDD